VWRILIVFRHQAHRAPPQFTGRARDAYGNFATVGDQQDWGCGVKRHGWARGESMVDNTPILGGKCQAISRQFWAASSQLNAHINQGRPLSA